MLEGLQDKFVDERVSLEKEEATKRHTYAARRFLGVQIGQGGFGVISPKIAKHSF